MKKHLDRHAWDFPDAESIAQLKDITWDPTMREEGYPISKWRVVDCEAVQDRLAEIGEDDREFSSKVRKLGDVVAWIVEYWDVIREERAHWVRDEFPRGPWIMATDDSIWRMQLNPNGESTNDQILEEHGYDITEVG